MRNTVHRFSPYTYSLRGEKFGSGLFIGRLTKFCPQCLLEDNARGHHQHWDRRERLAWLFRPITACPVHRISLHFAGPQPGIAPDLSCRVPAENEELRLLVDHATLREPSPLQAYLLARLEGAAGPSWLDGQTIEQAVGATEMLGAVLAFGARVNTNDLTVGDWHDAACTGWQWAKQGEAGLREAFSHIQSMQPKTRQIRGSAPGQAFGALYQWLANPHLKSDRGPIKDLLRTHILETEALTSDRTTLGEVVRRNHIARSTLGQIQPT